MIRQPSSLHAAAAFCDVNSSGHISHADSRFERLVQSVTDYAIYMLDGSGHVASWNPGAERFKGYTAAEIIGQHFSRFYTEADREKDIPRIALETAKREGRFEAEGWRVRKDGSQFWASIILDPIRDESGQVIGFAKVTRDLTDKKAMEERLRHSEKMDAIGQLTGGIAHDFNNFLMAISGSLEALQARMERDRSELDRYFDAAFGSIQRAAALTHRLLAFSRKQALEPRATDVNLLLSEIEDLVCRTVGPEFEVKLDLSPKVWPAMLDAKQLESALLNLCLNAGDAMPGGGSILIETSNTTFEDNAAAALDIPPGDYVRVVVSDTGAGMAEDVVARAFDPFFTTKPLGEGTGLGLSLVHGFVRQSGGQVELTSRPALGTSVCLILPRHSDLPPVQEQSLDRAPANSFGTGERILVIDDEPIIRMLVADVLMDLGYEVIEAFDGPSGLKALDSDVQFDLLITDVGLPGGMNGRQVADAARTSRPALKVLFITGYAEQFVVGDRALDDGMFLLSKPFLMDDLIIRTEQILAAR